MEDQPGAYISLNLGNTATIFQAEVTFIQICALETVQRCYTNRKIHIVTDSKAVLKALDALEIRSP